VNCPNIVVTKEAKASPINAGDEARFIIKVKNTGAGTATGVEVKDSLPNQTGLTWNENHADCSITGTMLNCSGGDFASMAPNERDLHRGLRDYNTGALHGFDELRARLRRQ
ncbi:MAG: DUF11 domain-containing protein, partial [Dehalococcoidia bacterium]|nr:DUF11 domain-containing protein [Dehalococcoidia bacterium]